MSDPLRPARHTFDPTKIGAPFFVPYDRRWTGPEDGAMPMADRDLPKLREIVPERWAQVIGGLPARFRFRLIRAEVVGYVPEIADVMALLDALPEAPDVLAQRAISEGAPAVPLGQLQRPPRYKQLNTRITGREYEQLEAAAHIVGANPTALARMLILGGMRKILAEHGRVYAAVVED